MITKEVKKEIYEKLKKNWRFAKTMNLISFLIATIITAAVVACCIKWLLPITNQFTEIHVLREMVPEKYVMLKNCIYNPFTLPLIFIITLILSKLIIKSIYFAKNPGNKRLIKNLLFVTYREPFRIDSAKRWNYPKKLQGYHFTYEDDLEHTFSGNLSVTEQTLQTSCIKKSEKSKKKT